MALISENDAKVLGGLSFMASEAATLAEPGSPSEQVAKYRSLMLKVNPLKYPPGIQLAPVALFEPARELRPGLTASIAVPNGAGPFPVLIHAHGHGLAAGSPPEYEPWIRQMASYGFVVVFPDYGWQPETSFQEQVDQMLFAVDWVKQNAAGLSVDADKMVLGGDSLGAALGFEVLLQSLENPAGPRFKAFACVDGIMFVPPDLFGMGNAAHDRLAELSDDVELPPFYFMVGSGDQFLGATLMAMSKLQSLNKLFEADIRYGMPHDFAKFPNVQAGIEANAKMMSFLKTAV